MLKIAIGSISGAVLATLLTVVLFWAVPLKKPLPTVDLQTDLIEHVMAVPDPKTPGQLVGWYFSADDKMIVEIVDHHRDKEKYTFYALVKTQAKTGQALQGTIAAYYIVIADIPYLVGVDPIKVKLTVPPDPPAKK